MTKEEFLELASIKWDELSTLQAEQSFYEYEKKFEQMWIEYGRQTLEKSISSPPADRRKKKGLTVGLARLKYPRDTLGVRG